MGQRIRIAAQLIDVSTGYQLWSERYDRELQDVFAVQDEIAEHITSRLKMEFATGTGPRERPKRNLEAYDAYLRGRFDWNKGTPDSHQTGFRHFERAIAIDPDFAEAHLGIAETLCQLVLLGADLTEMMPKMRASIARALELNAQLPDAHATLGYVNFWFDWNWVEAERCFVRAIELGPNSAIAHCYFAGFLTNLGRVEEAIEHARRTIELDPLWVFAHHTFGFCLYNAGRYAEALEAAPGAPHHRARDPDDVVSIYAPSMLSDGLPTT